MTQDERWQSRYDEVQKDSRNAAEADEDGGGRDEKFFSTAKPLSTGTTWKVATMSQHTEQ